MTPEALRENAGQVSTMLKVLANEDRLMLLCQLVTGSVNVSQLETATGIKQPTLSQQLGILRQEQLVATDKRGKYVYYRLADDKVIRIMETLWELYCDSDTQKVP